MTRCVKPPGMRVARTGGEWEHFKAEKPGVGRDSLTDYKQVLHVGGLAGIDVMARIIVMLEKAAAGQCSFGKAPKDAGEIESARSDVLELRWQFRDGFAGKQWLNLRLYFAEPAERDPLLLALHWHYKEGSGPHATPQADAILEAAARLNMGESRTWGLDKERWA